MTDQPKQEAARYNTGKTPLSMTLPLLTKLESLVSLFGSVKYASWNWIKGGKLTTPVDCMMRHVDAMRAGEWLDPDSGLPHAAHVRWNAGQALQWYYSGVLEWDLPKLEYTDQLDRDLQIAAARLEDAKAKYAAERAKAGL